MGNSEQYSLDYQFLNSQINGQKTLKVSGLPPGSLKKVAWDVVKFNDHSIDGLWQIKNDPDNGEYIIALYEDYDPGQSLSKMASAESPWEVYADASGQQLSILYRDTPLLRVASSHLGIEPSEAAEVAADLPAQLTSNASLRSALLAEIPPLARQKIMSKFPELKVQS